MVSFYERLFFNVSTGIITCEKYSFSIKADGRAIQIVSEMPGFMLCYDTIALNKNI